jgi:hypothetical protein
MAMAAVLGGKLLIPGFGFGPGAQKAGDGGPSKKCDGKYKGDQREENLQIAKVTQKLVS